MFTWLSAVEIVCPSVRDQDLSSMAIGADLAAEAGDGMVRLDDHALLRVPAFGSPVLA